MNVAWNPPGLSSAIDRLMDFWDENVSVPMRRIHSAQPPQSTQPQAPAIDADAMREHHERQGADTRGSISALAALAGG